MKRTKVYDVIILGAGASGLMCAGRINQQSGLDVLVIEGNPKPAAKLKISGGGKCNITNVNVLPKHFLGNRLLVERALQHFSKEALLELLRSNGLDPVIRKGRYYFCPKSADEIITILRRLSSSSRFIFGHTIEKVEKEEGRFLVRTDKGTFEGRRVVVATGGVSFASVGATDIGLKIAHSFGHSVKSFQPALVGLTLQPDQFWMKELTGISLPVEIRVDDRTIDEDLLFAHKGISGPAVLSASLYWHKGKITIDFLPGKKIDRLCQRSGKKQVSTVMNLPKRFSRAFLEHLGIEDKPCGKLRDDEIAKLSELHAYAFAPSGTFGFTKAEVSRGGVNTDELDHATLQSKKSEGLYFIGEVTDITGELGGYNFQWAFSSAVMCADGMTVQQ